MSSNTEETVFDLKESQGFDLQLDKAYLEAKRIFEKKLNALTELDQAPDKRVIALINYLEELQKKWMIFKYTVISRTDHKDRIALILRIFYSPLILQTYTFQFKGANDVME